MTSRERILEAAMTVFARFGYRRASMDQIADEVALTRQAVYHHFPSKEALFRAGVEALHEGAYEAEAAAGREQEQAGRSLADILARLRRRALQLGRRGHRKSAAAI
jgi:AcrR family transcriptional regulator